MLQCHDRKHINLYTANVNSQITDKVRFLCLISKQTHQFSTIYECYYNHSKNEHKKIQSPPVIVDSSVSLKMSTISRESTIFKEMQAKIDSWSTEQILYYKIFHYYEIHYYQRRLYIQGLPELGEL